MNLKKFVAALAVLPLLLLGACGTTTTPEIKTVVAKPGTCEGIMERQCTDSEKLLVLQTQVNDGQHAIPTPVREQLDRDKELLDAMAKLKLERERIQLQMLSLAASAKETDSCASLSGNSAAYSVCQRLQ